MPFFTGIKKSRFLPGFFIISAVCFTSQYSRGQPCCSGIFMPRQCACRKKRRLWRLRPRPGEALSNLQHQQRFWRVRRWALWQKSPSPQNNSKMSCSTTTTQATFSEEPCPQNNSKMSCSTSPPPQGISNPHGSASRWGVLLFWQPACRAASRTIPEGPGHGGRKLQKYPTLY